MHAVALGDEDWEPRLGNELCTPGRPSGWLVKDERCCIKDGGRRTCDLRSASIEPQRQSGRPVLSRLGGGI